MEVVLGDFDLDDEETSESRHTVVSLHYHPDYPAQSYTEDGTTKPSDLLLLEITPPATLDDYVQVLCLPENTEPPLGGDTCFSAGWRFAKDYEDYNYYYYYNYYGRDSFITILSYSYLPIAANQ